MWKVIVRGDEERIYCLGGPRYTISNVSIVLTELKLNRLEAKVIVRVILEELSSSTLFPSGPRSVHPLPNIYIHILQSQRTLFDQGVDPGHGGETKIT